MPGRTKAKESKPVTPAPRRKDLAAGAVGIRLSLHKKRSVWFQARASWPVREAPVDILVSERGRAKAALETPATAVKWNSIGPTNIGGRMTSIVCHPSKPDSILAGAAGGGVWQSDDAGRSWRSVWSDQDILNVGSLAIDPQSPATIYCGTGEANLSLDSYAGVGVYQSADSGKSWKLLARSSDTGIPTRIGVIAIDPFDSSHLLIGGVGPGRKILAECTRHTTAERPGNGKISFHRKTTGAIRLFFIRQRRR